MTRRTRARARRPPVRSRRVYTRRLVPVLRMLDIDMVARATLNGAGVDARLVNAISGLELDLTMDGASQLTVTVEDPDLELLRSELLEDRVDLALPNAGRWRMNRPRDVGGLAIAGGTTRLRLWDLGAAALQEHFDPVVKSARRMNLAGFVAFLAREVDAVNLRPVVPAPGEIPHLEQETRRDRVGRGTPAATSGWSPRAAAQVRVKGARATTEQLRVMDAVLTEAVRHDPPALAMLTLAAAVTVECEYVNKQGAGADAISFGVIQNIPGTSMGVDGVMTREQALDIAYSVRSALLPPGPTSAGGLIRVANQQPDLSPGRLADICINGVGVGDPLYVQKVDSYAAEARRNIELWTGRSFDSFRRGGGADGRSEQVRYRPPQWRRGTDHAREGSWKTLRRYADQLGRRRFIAGPTTRHPRLVMAQDQQLILATPHLVLDLHDDTLVLERPHIELEGRERLEQIELAVLTSGWSAPPGAVVDVVNGGPADGPWLTLAVRLRSGDPVAHVTLTQPMTRREPDLARSAAARRRRRAQESAGADEMVEWARSTLGVVEGSPRHRRWADDIGVFDPWCSVWIAYGLKHVAGLSLPAHPAYSGAWLDWSDGEQVSHASMQPGDLVIFDWGDGGITDHIALLVADGRVIGGNQSQAGTDGAVTETALSASAVVAVVRPKYRKG